MEEDSSTKIPSFFPLILRQRSKYYRENEEKNVGILGYNIEEKLKTDQKEKKERDKEMNNSTSCGEDLDNWALFFYRLQIHCFHNLC